MTKAKKREDGRLQKSITVGRNPDGSLKRKVIYARTQKELEIKAAALIQQIQNGFIPSNENATFGEVAEHLCRDFKPTVSEGVRKRYITTCQKHLGELTHLRVRDLKAVHLQTIINRLAKEGYATKSMSGIKQVASQVMRLAMDNDIVMRNVFEKVKIPSVDLKGENH